MSTQVTSAPEQSQQAATDHPLSRDDVFHLLQNARRRGVVRYLSEQSDDDESVYEMGAIAEQVAAWENDKPLAQLTSAERQRVYISLYQNHLPKLDEAGVIEYNQSRGFVEPRPRLKQLENYVAVYTEASSADCEGTTTTDESTPMKYYRGATVVSVLLFVATTIGLAPAAIAGSLSTIITGLFGATILGVESRLLR
jgi:hypothetical protein